MLRMLRMLAMLRMQSFHPRGTTSPMMHDLTQLTPEIDALPILTMPTPYDLTTDYHCALAPSLPAHTIRPWAALLAPPC
jgi:hypothetical protein